MPSETKQTAFLAVFRVVAISSVRRAVCAYTCACMRVYVRAYAQARAHALFMFNINIFFCCRRSFSFFIFFSFSLFLLSLFISFFFPLGCGGFPFFLLSFFFLAFSLFLILFFFLFLCVSNSFFFNYLKINMIQNFSFKNTKIRKSRNVNAFHKALKCR